MNRGGRPRKQKASQDEQEIESGVGLAGPSTVTADLGVYFSADGRRRNEELLNVSHKKRRIVPSDLSDPLGLWIPVPEDSWDDTALEAEEGGGEAEAEASAVPGEKRKRYKSSDDPMGEWKPLKHVFADALLWHDGLGDRDADTLCCDLCAGSYSPGSTAEERVRIFKCRQCGEFFQCESCCVERHKRSPLHVLKEWGGNFWMDATLRELGLVYQLGHGGGRCLVPDALKRTMVVVDHPHIHKIHFRYCDCDKANTVDPLHQLLRNGWYPATVDQPGTCATFTTLETFRLQNVVGNMNVNDFVTAMERQTNATGSTGLDKVPARYKEVMRMTRQWAWLHRMKRAGILHKEAGLGAATAGQGSVVCWACPYDGRNLPLDWRNVDPKYAFLYMLIVALDANFKLKSRIRANAHDDPSLGPGLEYFIEPEAYREHLRKYVPEKDISSCIAFAALLQKDSRSATGLRCTGVGGCVCARHECVRPNGLGDLQKGERYANMDYIALRALAGFILLWLTISYDIACQWRLTLRSRMEKMPEHLRLDLDKMKLQTALPVWHAASHEEECQNANSLSFKEGVGKSDGEGIERTWSVLNPAAYHTKDMNPGNREDTLNDKINNHNFLKNIGQGHALEAKLIIAIAERGRQVAAFTAVNATVERDVRKTWLALIKEWLQDSTKPNPYVLDKSDTPSEAQVRAALKKEEEEDAVAGRTPIHGTSATAFLTAGMQLEDAQRRIIAELKGRALVAPDRESKIQERRMTLLKKLSKFRTLQAVFMPGAAALIAEEESRRDSEAVPPRVEHIKLWMPSEMEDNVRTSGCIRGLAKMEARLRFAQCQNAMLLLRSRLHAKRHFMVFRTGNIHGQVQGTKANILVEQIGERVDASAERYRQGRKALLRLEGDAMDAQFQELKPEHIRLDGEKGESDLAAQRGLATIGSGPGARASRHMPAASSSRTLVSWIWTAQGGAAEGEEDIHGSVRVEWCRALARKLRWEEEVLLVREEMRRVVRYLDWQVSWWTSVVDARPDATRGVQKGVRAYALKQADLHARIKQHFQTTWDKPARVAARRVLAGAPDEALEGVDLDEFFRQ